MLNLFPIHRFWRLTFQEPGSGEVSVLGRFLGESWIYEGKFWRMVGTSTAEIGRGMMGWGKHRREISLKSLWGGYWAVGCKWKRLHFSSIPVSFLHFPALGTTREQMLRKSLLDTACCKLHDDFYPLYQCHEGLVVHKFVIRSGAQGDIKAIAPSLILAPLSF